MRMGGDRIAGIALRGSGIGRCTGVGEEEKIMIKPDYELCECGDYRIEHKNGVGECAVCRMWMSKLVMTVCH